LARRDERDAGFVLAARKPGERALRVVHYHRLLAVLILQDPGAARSMLGLECIAPREGPLHEGASGRRYPIAAGSRLDQVSGDQRLDIIARDGCIELHAAAPGVVVEAAVLIIFSRERRTSVDQGGENA
jgi:hypothetical protein